MKIAVLRKGPASLTLIRAAAHAHVRNHINYGLVIYLLLIGFIPYLIWLIALKVSGNIKSHRIEELNENGKTIFAKIIDFKQEDIFFRNIVMVRIIAKYFGEGNEYHFISEKAYPDNINNLQIGDTVKIKVNNYNFKQYYFDPKGQKA